MSEAIRLNVTVEIAQAERIRRAKSREATASREFSATDVKPNFCATKEQSISWFVPVTAPAPSGQISRSPRLCIIRIKDRKINSLSASS